MVFWQCLNHFLFTDQNQVQSLRVFSTLPPKTCVLARRSRSRPLPRSDMSKLILSMAFLFALCVQHGSAVAQSFGTYNSGRFPYGIGVPASWGKPQADAVRGGEIVSWTE